METLKHFIKDKKNQAMLFLGALCLLKSPEGGMRFALWVAGGIFVCVLLDFMFNKILKKKNFSIQSAVISGFIVSGILDYTLDWYVLGIFCAVAMISKHVIRIKSKHVFNPANFGLFAAALFRQPLTWNIESNIYLIIAVGLYLAISLRKWPHVLGFLATFVPSFYFSGVNPLNFISWFFVFVMLIEPKTSGFGTAKGIAYGAVAGLTSFAVFKFMPQIDIFITSLAVANIFNALLTIKGHRHV